MPQVVHVDAALCNPDRMAISSSSLGGVRNLTMTCLGKRADATQKRPSSWRCSFRLGLTIVALLLCMTSTGEPRGEDVFRADEIFVVPNPDGPPTQRLSVAFAAGMRALHLCTGIFTAGKDMAWLEASLSPAARDTKLQTVVDRQAKIVSVAYLPEMPPRVAVWRPLVGCTQLPAGALAADAERIVVGTTVAAEAPNFDDQAWPQGDQDALSAPSEPQLSVLDRVVAAAFNAEKYGGNTGSVLVLQDDRIRAERYAPGYDMHTAWRTHSMCKSVAASLIGVGVRKNLVDLRRRAPLREWSQPGDPRGAINIEHLLHMASGLYTQSAGNPQAFVHYGGAAAAERAALNILDSRPGTRFQYASTDTVLAMRALRQRYDDDAQWPTFPHRELLWKIGMTRTTPEMDWKGDFLMSGDCWSTTRDFARFGLLYLNDGVWRGERILPEGWAKYVATPSPANRRYGAQFWLFGGLSGLPGDTYGAFGAQGQWTLIVPSKNLIIVRRGLENSLNDFDIPRFAADVIKALRL